MHICSSSYLNARDEKGISVLIPGITGWAQIKRGLTTFEEVIRYADGMMDEDEVSVESSKVDQTLPPVSELQ